MYKNIINETLPKDLPIWYYKKSGTHLKRVKCNWCNELQNETINLWGNGNSKYYCFECWDKLMKTLTNIKETLILQEL
jgi:hypothetical protein